ncbi:MAG: hypothetical protein Q8K82_15950 [Gemmatimonadaceae bacterium]|nr:hypothetical protein [Gemmatimonadaceae bacterium]
MGQTDMKGGVAKIGEIDPVTIGAGTTMSGTVCNELKVKVTDLDFTLKKAKPPAGNVEVKGLGGQPVAFDAAGKAHADYPTDSGLEGNKCQDYLISGIEPDASGSNVVIYVTPSSTLTVAGNLVHCNVLSEFKFDAMSDLARHGIAQMHHACVLAVATNEDHTESLTSFSGSVSLLDVSEALTGVHLLDVRGNPVPNATVSLSGNQFTITGFSPIDPGKTVYVAMVFSNPIGGTRMRAQLQAIYDQ